MKIIKPYVEVIKESDPFKLIEKIGRTCYKSEDKITEDSCYKFVANMIKREHYAMLEHARYTFEVDNRTSDRRRLPNMLLNIPGVVAHEISNTGIYIVGVSLSHLYNRIWGDARPLFDAFLDLVMSDKKSIKCEYPNSNNTSMCKCTVKLVNVNDWPKMFGELSVDASSEQWKKEWSKFIYHTVKFVCDRGVSHELVRHRVSVAQESTRYCNYSKEKFGGQVTFVEPSNYSTMPTKMRQMFEDHLENCESTYLAMLNDGATPQEARAVLPNALKTEVVLTMNEDQWKHFFDLRSRGATGDPHPDMKVVADMAQKLLNL